MQMKHLKLASFAAFAACTLAACAPSGSFTPGAVWEDNNGVHINAHGGGILYDDGIYYWFGEHKTEGKAGNVANVGVHCYSSSDLYHWKDEGIALSVMPEGSGSDIEKGCILERPKVIKNEKTGKYVMWFHLESKGRGYDGNSKSGVAVSDKVTGPYTFLHTIRPNAGHWPLNVQPCHLSGKIQIPEGYGFSGGNLPMHADTMNILGRDMQGGQMARDMNLFVDDDGKAYHIYSSEENSTLHISRLNDDYTGCSGEYIRAFVGRFMEAPAMFKKDGKYYLMMSGCSGWAPNEARSAVADAIFGDWKELGNPCLGDDVETTFHSQSTYIFPVQGTNKFIYMGDRWTPQNAIDGRYIWLPVEFTNEKFTLQWQNEWQIKGSFALKGH
ncbi:beta-glucanase [Bacteroidia bacterium]|nr:beta-glucanase [Bacteroidia bacterium]